MRPAHVQAFIDLVLPFARTASEETGLPVSVVLAQWATESGWGSNEMAKRNNLGCIMQGSVARSYPDLSAFARDYIRVLLLGAYAEVRRLGASGADPLLVAGALGRSPYSESHYRDRQGRPGGYLMQVMADFGLPDYDEGPEDGG